MSTDDNPFHAEEKIRQVPTNVVLPVIFREKLRFLSKATKVPQATYIREALRDLLDKYQDQFVEAPEQAITAK